MEINIGSIMYLFAFSLMILLRVADKSVLGDYNVRRDETNHCVACGQYTSKLRNSLITKQH
jgi:hypothetical protein